ncbi:MAG: hypothetical protein GQ574_07455 [Crocinitomix sp.]|nr:hypothetical protein [Crocinitomix sp.]
MKFLPEEHQSISALLIEGGLTERQYSFRKKRGQLHIEIKDRSDTFCFYRKIESSFDANMKFVDETTYLLGPKKDVIVENWEDVLAAIKVWL